MDYNNYSDLFTNLDSQESIFIWTVILVSFLLGFFIAYLLRTGKIRRLKRELRTALEKQQAAENQLANLQSQLDQRNSELQAESREKVDLMDRVAQLEREKKGQYNEIYELNQRIESLDGANRSYAATIDDLNGQVVDLKARNEQLRSRPSAPQGVVSPSSELEQGAREALQLRLTELETKMTRLLTENDQLRIDLADLQSSNSDYATTVEELNARIAELKAQATEPATTSRPAGGINEEQLQDRLAAFETRLTQLAAENDRLRTDLLSVKQSNASFSAPVIDLAGDTEPLGATAAPREEPPLKVVSDKTVLQEKIIIDDRPKDDLTLIEGVGPFLAGKLNDIGVYTYEDIATWSPSRVDEVTRQIGHLPGRVEKDQWVEQAARLARIKREHPESAPLIFGHQPRDNSDLKIIEGIGPKIEEVLQSNGINNWSELAGTDPGRLREILESAGDRFRMHNPYTWPLQARLAAAGRWEELEEYQEELKGGREVNE